MEYPYNLEHTTSLCNQVYAVPINFILKDFFDHKTLSSTGGRLRAFEKISIAEIHVEVEIHTKKVSAFENDWYLYAWRTITEPTVAEMQRARKDLTWKPQYLVNRDANGDHSKTAGSKGPNTENATPNTEQTSSRKLQSLRKKDQTTDIVSNGFSFTRKVTAGGPYYVTSAKQSEIRDENIALLINEIEGQSADASGNLLKWPECFNFLIATLNADMVSCAINGKTACFTPNFHTEFHVKTTATWLCMQNSQTTGTVGRKSDPYFAANKALNM